MLVLLALLLCPSASWAHEHLCPEWGNAEIAVPCGVAAATGLCDVKARCRPGLALNSTCSSKLPCTGNLDPCTCTDLFTCQRRLPSGKTGLLVCQHQNHDKRQEALNADDDADDDDDDDSSRPSDDTAVFLAILGIFYVAMLCIALIYVRPGE